MKYLIGREIRRIERCRDANEDSWLIVLLVFGVWLGLFGISLFVNNPCPIANPYHISGWIVLAVGYLALSRLDVIIEKVGGFFKSCVETYDESGAREQRMLEDLEREKRALEALKKKYPDWNKEKK